MDVAPFLCLHKCLYVALSVIVEGVIHEPRPTGEVAILRADEGPVLQLEDVVAGDGLVPHPATFGPLPIGNVRVALVPESRPDLVVRHAFSGIISQIRPARDATGGEGPEALDVGGLVDANVGNHGGPMGQTLAR